MVEIMVALAVSLFLLAGVVSVFISNKQAFRVQDGASFLQENARFAMAFLGRSIRMGGHWGGVEYSDVEIDSGLSLSATGNCDQAWMTDLGYGLQGFEGAGAISGVAEFPSNCLAASDYVPNTDILVVRYADSDAASNGDVFLRSELSRKAVLGQAPSSGSLPTFGISDKDALTYNYPYKVEIWFIRPCSNRAGGTSASACDAADDDDNPIPTLTVLSLSGTSLTQQSMLEGIEQLQFEYGRDLDNDGNLDRFDTAATLNALPSGQRRTAWRQVSSVRVALLVRSAQYDSATEDTATYYLTGDLGAQSGGVSVATDDRHYLRKQYQQTLQVRNRVRG
jgi:Tfp pilus assembly protein PilW